MSRPRKPLGDGVTRYTVDRGDAAPCRATLEHGEATCDLPATRSLVVDHPEWEWMCAPMCPLHLAAEVVGTYRDRTGMGFFLVVEPAQLTLDT